MTTELVAGLLGGLVGYALKSGEKPPSDAEVIEALRETKPVFIKTIAVDTTEARSNQEYIIAGGYLFVENPETPSLPVYIRLNEPDAEQLELTTKHKIKAPFYRFFITNAAGVGTLNLVIGKVPAFELAEAITNIKITAQVADIDIKLVASAIMMPVDIQAQYLNLNVDIVAQTIGDIGIDISAQTIGNLAVNIAASATTLQINIASQSAFNMNVNIAAQTANVNINLAASAIMMPVDIQAQYLNLNVDIVAQTIGDIGIDIKAQTIGNLAVNIAASAITLQINIASQSAFNMNVNIAAQTANVNINLAASAITLNVNLQSQTANIDINLAAQAANINVDIKAASVTMNVAVAGTANIQIVAQNVGIWTGGDWEAKAGNHVQLAGYESASAGNYAESIRYTVPLGKAFYVSYIGGGLMDSEADTMVYIKSGSAVKCYACGMAGVWMTFPKPLVFGSQHVVQVYIFNGDASIRSARACIGGIVKYVN